MWFLIRKCIQKQNSTDIYRFKNMKNKGINDKANVASRVDVGNQTETTILQTFPINTTLSPQHLEYWVQY